MNTLFPFLARQGVIAALFIIFLGVVPLIAIIVLLTYYARQNFRFGWKKSSSSTYVTNCLQHAVFACHGVGSFFKKSSTATTTANGSCDSHNKQPLHRNDIEIKQTGLISTTNTDCILRSKTITKKDDIAESNCKDQSINSNPKSVPKSEWRVSLKTFKRLNLKIDHIKTEIDNPKTAEIVLSDDDTPPHVSVKNLTKQLDFAKQIPSAKV